MLDDFPAVCYGDGDFNSLGLITFCGNMFYVTMCINIVMSYKYDSCYKCHIKMRLH